ncbi:MAG: hypothetical protein M1824_005972 [Vezdaea acicularis]|nr:MAG: hypothetical protein M1824_005972 [Vezdaea acicularis]
MRLSKTESNLIGTAANFGMYSSGIPVGILVDAKGPRIPVMIGAIALGVGYFPIYRAYESGPGSLNVGALCFFSFLSGVGSCGAFAAAVKTCNEAALNYPLSRGTATAFPLAAFGLSAAFFAGLSALAFHDRPSDFLFLLAAGTFSMVFVSWFFLRVIPHSSYHSLPSSERRRSLSDSQRLSRRKSADAHRIIVDPAAEIGSQTAGCASAVTNNKAPDEDDAPLPDADETSSLMSKQSSETGDLAFIATHERGRIGKLSDDHAQHIDVRGLALLPRADFWLIFTVFGLMTGIGLMTINNIGNDAQALWTHYDDSASPPFIQSQQILHVSILSLLSFLGRLLSGIGSDLLVRRHVSRFWCFTASSTLFLLAQLAALRIQNPSSLWLLSALSGLAYGTLFGVSPAVIAHAFGIHGLSLNWGCLTLAPVITGNIFNLFYGAFFDAHSELASGSDGQHRVCADGNACYRAAYLVTAVASVGCLVLSLGLVWAEGRGLIGAVRKRAGEGEGRVA